MEPMGNHMGAKFGVFGVVAHGGQAAPWGVTVVCVCGLFRPKSAHWLVPARPDVRGEAVRVAVRFPFDPSFVRSDHSASLLDHRRDMSLRR